MAGAVVLTLSLACGRTVSTSIPTPTPTPTHIGTLVLMEATCTLEGAATTVPAGPISLAVFNRTTGDVVAVVVQIAPGHTFDELVADVENAKRTAEAGVPQDPEPPSYMIGLAPLNLGPGGSTIHTRTMLAGTHAIMCVRKYESTGQAAPYAYVGPIEVRPR